MNIILFDDNRHLDLRPLTYTRPIGDLRLGILRIHEKWSRRMNAEVSFLTMPYLMERFPIRKANDNILINAAVLPNNSLCDAIGSLGSKQVLLNPDGAIVAMHIPKEMLDGISLNLYMKLLEDMAHSLQKEVFRSQFDALHRCSDIFALNEKELQADFDLLCAGRTSADLSGDNRIRGEQFFAEEGATAYGAIFNATSGPVYLANNSEVMEGATVRGGLALCEHATLKMGSKIYGPTTIGPHSKVGGEVNNCVIQGYTNKGHDGFIGNSVIGEWCNLGADTNTSNLKNNYGEVKTWSYRDEALTPSGRHFVGLTMGDHSKCGINTMFNTGTTVGVFANVFGTGFPPKFIPSFAWGGQTPFETYELNKALEVAKVVMSRRDIELSAADENILKEVFELSARYRS